MSAATELAPAKSLVTQGSWQVRNRAGPCCKAIQMALTARRDLPIPFVASVIIVPKMARRRPSRPVWSLRGVVDRMIKDGINLPKAGLRGN